MKPEEEFRYLVLAAQRESNRLLANALRPLKLTPSQAEVLRVLEGCQPATLVMLGTLLVCETGSPSRLVSGLVDRGLIERHTPKTDRRTTVLSLTNEGATLATRVKEAEKGLYERVMQTGDNDDLARTNTILRKFIKGLPTGKAIARRDDDSLRKAAN